MKTGTTTHYVLCRNRTKPDARCRRLPRCRSCGRVLRVFDHAPDICHECVMLERARAAADAEKWRLLQAEQLLSEYRRTQKRSRS